MRKGIHLEIIYHISGVFTVPVSGAWRVSYSLRSEVSWGDRKQANSAYIYHNTERLEHSIYFTYSDEWVKEMASRTVILKAWAGDSIKLWASSQGNCRDILTCFEYLHD